MNQYIDLLPTIPTPEMIETWERARKAEAQRERKEKEAADRRHVSDFCKEHRDAFVRTMVYDLAHAIEHRDAPVLSYVIAWPMKYEPPVNATLRIAIFSEHVLALFHEEVAPLFRYRGWNVAAYQSPYDSTKMDIEVSPAP